MLTPAAKPAPARTPGLIAAAALALAAMFSPPPARAAEPAAGLTVQFPAIITEDVTTRLRSAVYVPLKHYQEEQQRQGKPAAGFKLLCDFNPDNRADPTDDFLACYLLAKELRALQQKGVRTRAWVHGDVSRQAVLPVLACGEIVMSADPPSRLGRVIDPERRITDTERTAYEELLGAPYAPAVVRKMYDRDLVVVKVFPPPADASARYLDKKKADADKLNAQEWDGPHAGELAFYDFKQASAYGLCKPDAQNTLADALADFGLPRSSVSPLLERTTAVRIEVRGDIDGQLKEDVERRLDRALGGKASVIIIQLECGGGDDQAAYDVAQFIAGLKDRADRPVKTIAYVASPATDTAVFLALACDQIYMQKDAHLGDFKAYLQEHPDRQEPMAKNLKAVADQAGYPPELAEGMVRSDVHLVQAEASKGAGEVRILTDQERADDEKGPNPHGWQVKADVKPAGEYLRLSADDASKYGVAEEAVSDYDKLCSVENVRPTDLGGDWLNALADFLCNPWTSVVLVMIGVMCLIIELKMPGASLPGVIAAVCFVLFFWSHSQVAGEIMWLAVLLFILGLVLIGIEVFVLPGTGVCGVSGAILAVGSLVLVAFGHWPQTGEDWAGFGQKSGPFGLGILAAVVLAFVVARYLKHIPYLNRMILKPPAEAGEDGEALAPEPAHPELASLLGAIGVAATPLRPAGKTQFGDQFVDVVAEGGFVHPGARVQVVEIEGNRVVVKQV